MRFDQSDFSMVANTKKRVSGPSILQCALQAKNFFGKIQSKASAIMVVENKTSDNSTIGNRMSNRKTENYYKNDPGVQNKYQTAEKHSKQSSRGNIIGETVGKMTNQYKLSKEKIF